MVYNCICKVCKRLRKLYGRGFQPSDVDFIEKFIANGHEKTEPQTGPSLCFVLPTIQENESDVKKKPSDKNVTE